LEAQLPGRALAAQSQAYGARRPGWLDGMVIAATSRLPDNWLGLRLAIGLRRIVTMRLADDDGFDVVRWGLRMRLHPRRNGCEKGALFTPQMYEAGERVELFAEIDKAQEAGRGLVFVDIGANVGLFSLLVASRAGARAKILAIEPEPENLRRLRFNVAANPGIPIRVIPLALGESRGLVALEVDRHDRGGTHTRALTGDDDVGKVEGGCRAPVVECRTLLEVLREEGISRIDALKADVEGAEDAILVPFFRDAPQALWPNLVIIEDARAKWRNDLFSLLAQCGYTVASRTRLNVMLRRAVPGAG
jgi:FkbM family methyltransferase